MQQTDSTKRRLVDDRLGDNGPVEEFVHTRRRKSVSWRRIAIELSDVTGEPVTHETLRNWVAS